MASMSRSLLIVVALLYALAGVGHGFRIIPLLKLTNSAGFAFVATRPFILHGIPIAALLALACARSGNPTISKIGNVATWLALGIALAVWIPSAIVSLNFSFM
jgi:hypothetical protein